MCVYAIVVDFSRDWKMGKQFTPNVNEWLASADKKLKLIEKVAGPITPGSLYVNLESTKHSA